MNDMKPVEELLRSWKPRTPSDNIRATLFGRSKPAVGFNRFLPLIAPMTACLLAVGALFSTDNNFTSDPKLPVLFASVSSNAVVSQPPTRDEDAGNVETTLQHNVWDRATFDWTNKHLWTSSIRSLDTSKTNDLR